MARKRTHQREAQQRPRAAPLGQTEEATSAKRRQLVPALKEALHRVEGGERLPPYLQEAVERFAAAEDKRVLRLQVRNAVIRAADEGYPLTPGTVRRTTAFERVAEMAGESVSWVLEAYRNRKREK